MGCMTADPRTDSARQESFARQEREALAGLLLSQGPDSPTLCEGWDNRAMAVHLYVREYRPDAAPGIFLKPLKGRLDLVSKQLEKRPFEDLVEAYRSGPPKWNPIRLIDSFVNLSENFIHHEDVRRGVSSDDSTGGGGEQIAPRDLSPKMRAALWGVVRQMSRVILRADGVKIVVEGLDANPSISSDKTARQVVGSAEGDEVRIVGESGELLLWLFGRDDAAQVEIIESKPGARLRISRRSM